MDLVGSISFKKMRLINAWMNIGAVEIKICCVCQSKYQIGEVRLLRIEEEEAAAFYDII